MPDPGSSSILSASKPLVIEAVDDIAVLTRRLTAGEEAAWGWFFDRYRARLIGYLARLWQGEPSALDDLLQETLLRAVRYMRPFDSEEVFWSWLTVLARSAVADRGRHHSRWRRFLDQFRRETAIHPWAREPEHFEADLLPALASLDDLPRQLLEEKYFDRLSVREIARRHELTEKAVERRLSRSRKLLARLLQSDQFHS
jgi:RNA polymerase sigma factor (sigma-70 family)